MSHPLVCFIRLFILTSLFNATTLQPSHPIFIFEFVQLLLACRWRVQIHHINLSLSSPNPHTLTGAFTFSMTSLQKMCSQDWAFDKKREALTIYQNHFTIITISPPSWCTNTSVTHLDQPISLETSKDITKLLDPWTTYFFALGGKYIIILDE